MHAACADAATPSSKPGAHVSPCGLVVRWKQNGPAARLDELLPRYLIEMLFTAGTKLAFALSPRVGFKQKQRVPSEWGRNAQFPCT